MSDLLETIQDGVYQLLVKHGVEDGAAGDDAAAFCDRLRREYGGSEYYIPRRDKRLRDVLRADRAAGQPLKDVAAKHGVSPSTVSRAAKADDDSFASPDWEL